MMGISQGLQGY